MTFSFKNPFSSILLSCVWVVFLHVYLCTICVQCPRGQKRASDPTYGCWELNIGPLEEHLLLLTFEPLLQPVVSTFYVCI